MKPVRSDNLIKSSELIEKESIFKIGHVIGVKGRTIDIGVDKDKNLPHTLYKGNIIKNAAVGSYIKIAKGFTDIIAKIESENDKERSDEDTRYSKREYSINRLLIAAVIGCYEGGEFKQGAVEIPLIGSPCYLLDRSEFESIHEFADENGLSIRIGALAEESTQAIEVSVNQLFASHIGIFGNTGSGKSNTLTRIYSNLFKLACKNKELKVFRDKSKFLVIDFNGEYVGDKVFSEDKEVFQLNTSSLDEDSDSNANDKYPMQYKYISKLEILSILLGATEKTQQPFLRRSISGQHKYSNSIYRERIKEILKNFLHNQKSSVGLETIFSFLRDVGDFVEQKIEWEKVAENTNSYLGKYKDGSFYYESQDVARNHDSDFIYGELFSETVNTVTLNYKDNLNQLRLKILIYYYKSLAMNQVNPEHVGPLMNRMKSRFKMLDKVIKIEDKPRRMKTNLVIISLKNVNLEMKKILPLLACKQLYDTHKAKPRNHVHELESIHMIIDEAHNILSKNSEREGEDIKDYRLETFEEIIKEGRKFGSFLTIASQRPQDISPTIISQLHNYFIHRLMNTHDINIIGNTVSYLDKLSFESIPILSVGHCFMAGTATSMPVQIQVDKLEDFEQPASQTINLEDAWRASS